MTKLTWKNMVDTHNCEMNAKRTLWRVIGYGLRKKGRMGYTVEQLEFILSKNFKGVTFEEWGIAIIELEEAGFIKKEKAGKKVLMCLTETGKDLFDKKYDI